MTLVDFMQEQGRTSVIFAPMSPSHLSESCKNSFLVLGWESRSGDPFGVEWHVLSFRREWLAQARSQ